MTAVREALSNHQPSVRADRILLFIGSGRTGSTLLGQLINHHPECLIANESRLLTRWIAGEGSFDALLAEAGRTAYEQFLTGLERAGRFADSNARSQPRWRPFAGLGADPSLRKLHVRVVGDKKAGGATDAIVAHGQAIARLMRERPIVLLHLIRDPVAATLSAMRSHGATDFAEACSRIVAQHAAAAAFGRAWEGRYLRVCYEDLCRSPREELARIAEWLGLPIPARWLAEMAARVGPLPETPDSCGEVCRRIVREHGAEDLFARYDRSSGGVS